MRASMVALEPRPYELLSKTNLFFYILPQLRYFFIISETGARQRAFFDTKLHFGFSQTSELSTLIKVK